MRNRDWEGDLERNETANIQYEKTRTRETAMGKRSETTKSLGETLNTIRRDAAMRERDETTMIQYEKTRRNLDEIPNTIRGETTRRRRKTRLEEERHSWRRASRGAEVYGHGAVVRLWARIFRG